jgi:uncharacterized membrane protein YphA (DoxX/SURF4 family)
MDASTTADFPGRTLEMPPWKTVASHISAALLALLFLVSGVWKITDPFGWQHMMEEFLVPAQLSMPLTLAVGLGETFGAALILVPRFRRWGAWILSLLLIAFMVFIGIHYTQLVGKDCSCFPVVKRAINPAFFLEDGVMLAAAIVAGLWARPSSSKRSAAVVLGAVAVFAAVSYGYAYTHLTGARAPESITVEGKPYSLQQGHIFLFFYDPNCGHCDAAARAMSKLHWKSDVTIVAIPTQQPRFAAAFLRETGLKAVTSLDLEMLKKVFPFGDPPYGVLLENGRERGPVPHYEDNEPADTLRKAGFVE